MVRQRFIYCGIAAAFILSGVAQAQEMGTTLRPSLAASETPSDADEADGEAVPAVVAKATTLEVNPLVEPPPPPPRKRRREEDPYAALGLDMGGLTLFPVLRAGVVVSDNPESANSDRKGDIGLRLRP